MSVRSLRRLPVKRAVGTRAETPALLNGLPFGPDGVGFSPVHTHTGDKIYRYYLGQKALKNGAGSCPLGRVPEGEIEATVFDQLRAVCRHHEIVAGTCNTGRHLNGAVLDVDQGSRLCAD